ncbi:MAG: hypothetical protein IPF45_06840 [Thermomonas sp.]|nr:hypothetical protein [Thermomonas sp.]
MNKIMVHAAASLLVLALGSVHASGINSINGGMPNRISMNVTVPKQTQGATFGEKVNSGLQASGRSAAQGASLSIVIECGQVACAFVFPDGSGHRADLQRRRIEALASAQGAALRRGSPPRRCWAVRCQAGAVISAAVSSVGNLAGSGGGAAAAAYAATGRASDGGKEGLATASAVPGVIDVVEPLGDGDYALTLVVEADTNGAKGAPRTQVYRVATAGRNHGRVRVGWWRHEGTPRHCNEHDPQHEVGAQACFRAPGVARRLRSPRRRGVARTGRR